TASLSGQETASLSGQDLTASLSGLVSSWDLASLSGRASRRRRGGGPRRRRRGGGGGEDLARGDRTGDVPLIHLRFRCARGRSRLTGIICTAKYGGRPAWNRDGYARAPNFGHENKDYRTGSVLVGLSPISTNTIT